MKVRLCDKNKGKNKILKHLEGNIPGLDVKVKKCIDMCKCCSKSMIAKVDNKELVADNKEQLIAKIEERLKTR